MRLCPITMRDATTAAGLHIRSWRSASCGILADSYLDGATEEERHATWRARLADSGSALRAHLVGAPAAEASVGPQHLLSSGRRGNLT